jgi:hypothetical protein
LIWPLNTQIGDTGSTLDRNERKLDGDITGPCC